MEPVSHWEDYGGPDPRFACDKLEEHCHNCGRRLVTHFEWSGSYSRKTGEPTYTKYHSCPTWVTGWRARWWARGWALPGYGHDSHDAENPLSARAYR